ncbi:C2 domain-containing protein At1g53590-like [Triticum dicoccoides]|uniref:C2 domain-containing protein At1g53590-like n=1 Tax=Triticum dicoccoides TaxID=85692 RepID=UPI00188E7D0E|nr:C2 domain-containing protein At1g53590-like [Triticum dicoccoides]
MDITEVTVVHHVALVLAALWAAGNAGWAHPALFLLALVYIFAVNGRYTMRLKKRLQFEEKRSANQRRLLSDAETVRWLNYAVEKMWPVCMERVASQQFLLPIFPWFISKFKPWTARKAEIQSLYLGQNPPMFTDIRVVSQSTDDDHLVLELGMNFLAADDMDARMAVQLRKRLGFGITANMHITGMHIEGKVLVGVRFLQQWPFIGRVRVCFVEPPYFQMTVKPLFSHGLDVTELPGISGWLDRMLDVAFGQTLVEPNMLVIDMEKFASESESTDNWFTVDEKPPIAHAKVEIMEGADMKPSDPNGLSDPYVKGQLGPYRFQTKIHKKTLNPKWLEQFKIPITSWESSNLLSLQVRDKDHIFDDPLGNCSISINKLRGGQRHDMWIPLKHIKTGRVHIAVTVLEDENGKVPSDEDELCGTPKEGKASTPGSSFSSKTNTESASSAGYRNMTDEYEPVDIKGLEKAGVWVHRPGSDVAATWEPRKGRARCQDSQILRENDGCSDSPRSSVSESQTSNSSTEEPASGNKSHRHLRKVKKGLVKLAGAMRHNKNSKNTSDDEESSPCETPHPNIRPVGESRVLVTYVVDEDARSSSMERRSDDAHSSPERAGEESPTKGQLRKKAAHMVKHAGKAAHNLKSMLSRKGLDKGREDECRNEEEGDLDVKRVDSFPARSGAMGDAAESLAGGKDKAL